MSKFNFSILKRGYHDQYVFNQEFQAKNIEESVNMIIAEWPNGVFSGELIDGPCIKQISGNGNSKAICLCPFHGYPYGGFGGYYEHSRIKDYENWVITK